MYVAILALALLSVAVADKHAIIIAPRANWDDYGVQSETCRMYKDIVAGGVNPDNIILMSTNKVSESKENPYKGDLYTDDSPYAPGKDYAHGCIEHIDYEEEFMTGDVMLAIMRGDTDKLRELTGMENPRALKSTEEDEVFMYFSSHGGVGRIVVGETRVTDEELLETIKYMYEHKMYKHFFFMLEACYSGSMFASLPKNLNVFAITAADDEHSSYESHCPPFDVIDGLSMKTCLSCYWDNAIEWFIEGGSSNTLMDIHAHAFKEVSKKSIQMPSKFGDLEGVGAMEFREFVGEIPRRARLQKEENDVPVAKADVPAHLAKWEAIRATQENKEQVMKKYEEIVRLNAKHEVEVMRLGAALLNEKMAHKAFTSSAKVYSSSCVSELADALVTKCGHSYPMNQNTMNMLKNICIPGFSLPSIDFAEICM